MTSTSTHTAQQHEIDRQREVLIDLGYPARAGLSPDHLRDLVEPLRPALLDAAHFALVVAPTLLPPSARVELLDLGGRAGTLSRHFADVDSFADVVEVPTAPVYAVLGPERGDEFRGVRPGDAAAVIAERDRTPLTVAEGFALLHAFPDMLEQNHCFHTGGTRGGDRRVPAFWISERAPHLGWCWESNHHTWLGYASAAARVSG